MNYLPYMTGLSFLKFRLDKRLSQSRMATILGVSVVTIKSWEHERRNIPLSINNFIRLSLAMVSGDKLAQISDKLSACNEFE